ncbi:MAG: GNAT family N-acetyltransferase [Candidatus Omnitrophota bacterium]
MTLKIEECAAIPDERPLAIWENILSAQAMHPFFHTPQWPDLLCKVIPGARPCHRWLKFTDSKEAIFPLISMPKKFCLRKLESLPWGTYGGLIGGGLTDEHLRAAASSVLSWREPVCEIALPPSLEEQTGAESSIDWRESFTHTLDLSCGFEEIWRERFQPRTRTAIRRAQENGVAIRWSNNESAVRVMRDLYRQARQRWEGVETLPDAFFEALTDYPGEWIRIWLAEKNGEPLAANVIFYGKGEVQYFAGASDLRFSNDQGSKILTSEIIRDACERGCALFNFGASGGLPGVEQFKRLFGGGMAIYRRMRFLHPWLNIIR